VWGLLARQHRRHGPKGDQMSALELSGDDAIAWGISEVELLLQALQAT